MSFEVTKITFELVDSKGKRWERSLDNKDECEKWHKENVKLLTMAEDYGIEYNWNNLNWKMYEIKSEEK